MVLDALGDVGESSHHSHDIGSNTYMMFKSLPLCTIQQLVSWVNLLKKFKCFSKSVGDFLEALVPPDWSQVHYNVYVYC